MRGCDAALHRRSSSDALAAALKTRAPEPRAGARALALRVKQADSREAAGTSMESAASGGSRTLYDFQGVKHTAPPHLYGYLF